MQKRISRRLTLLIFLFFSLSINAWSVSNFCVFQSDQDKTIQDLSEEEFIEPEAEYSIPRDQVLLEIFTGTW